MQEQDKQDDTLAVEEVVLEQLTGAMVDGSVPPPLNHLDTELGGSSNPSHPPRDENADRENSHNTSADTSEANF